MDTWTFLRYRQPYLRVDAITRKGSRVELVRRRDLMSVACGSRKEAADVAKRLEELRTAGGGGWSSLRYPKSTHDRKWFDLIAQLDDLQLVGDVGLIGSESASETGARVAQAVDRAAKGMIRSLSSLQRKELSAVLSSLQRDIEALMLPPSAKAPCLADGATWDLDGGDLPIAGCNFYLAVARCQFMHFSRCSPPSLAASRLLMTVALNLLEEAEAKSSAATRKVEESSLCSGSIGLFDLSGVVAHVTSIAHSCRESISGGARRQSRPSASNQNACTGSNFSLLAEDAVRDTLEQLGTGRYVATMKGVRRSRHPVVVGTYVEQYHVTRRFVEIITPLLSKQLAPEVRSLLFRYFQEEYGHEKFERDTCLALGVGSEALSLSTPLPMTTAFVDVLTALATADPLGFLVSVTATEGLHGQEFKMSELLSESPELRRAAGRHDSLNVELNHSSIPRLALAYVESVPPLSQARALAHLAFILELNFRSWESIGSFYGRQRAFKVYDASIAFRPAPRARPEIDVGKPVHA